MDAWYRSSDDTAQIISRAIDCWSATTDMSVAWWIHFCRHRRLRQTHQAQASVMRSVTTSSQKILDKLERKDKRRAGARGTDADLDWLATRGFDELVEAEIMRDSKCAIIKQPHWVFLSACHTPLS